MITLAISPVISASDACTVTLLLHQGSIFHEEFEQAAISEEFLHRTLRVLVSDFGQGVYRCVIDIFFAPIQSLLVFVLIYGLCLCDPTKSLFKLEILRVTAPDHPMHFKIYLKHSVECSKYPSAKHYNTLSQCISDQFLSISRITTSTPHQKRNFIASLYQILDRLTRARGRCQYLRLWLLTCSDIFCLKIIHSHRYSECGFFNLFKREGDLLVLRLVIKNTLIGLKAFMIRGAQQG